MNFSAGCDTIYLLSVGCIKPCGSLNRSNG
nr:MAG TPA: hypothetical protein [Bacteriophage sp.]